jgi:hypothetical protein
MVARKAIVLANGLPAELPSGDQLNASGLPFELVVAASDETTAIAAGTAKITFRMPRAVTLTEVSVDVDQVGDGTAKGLKVMLIGVYA